MRTPFARRTLLFGLAIAVALLVVGLFASRSEAPLPDVGGAVSHFQPAGADARAVLISPDAERLPHKPGVVPVELIVGTVPPHAVQARVLTDEDCAPDAAGVSHCLNRLDVAGVEVAVRHSHRMHEVSCLSPGELVRLIDRGDYDAL
jgi:hypothetical protein